MKWRMLRSQMNVIINPNSQQHAEMEFEMLHTYKYVPVELLWKEPLWDAGA